MLGNGRCAVRYESLGSVEDGRCGGAENAAGGRGVCRKLWVCYPDLPAITQGYLAKARFTLGYTIGRPFGAGECCLAETNCFSTRMDGNVRE